MSHSSVQSPAVLKKNDGASKVGTSTGETVEQRLAAASTAIGDEATTRANADNTLSQDITDEATARAGADTALQDQINNLPPAGLTLLGTAVAADTAAIDFTDIDGTYDVYELHVINFLPGNDGAMLRLVTSSDNGTTFDTGASDYVQGRISAVAAGVTYSTFSSGNIEISRGVGNAAGEPGHSGRLTIYAPSAAKQTHITFIGHGEDVVGNQNDFIGGGQRVSENAVDAIRFFASTGLMAQGTFKLYGVVT